MYSCNRKYSMFSLDSVLGVLTEKDVFVHSLLPDPVEVVRSSSNESQVLEIVLGAEIPILGIMAVIGEVMRIVLVGECSKQLYGVQSAFIVLACNVTVLPTVMVEL